MRTIITDCKHEDFPVGTRVKVITDGVDFWFFRGETGHVIRNGGGYLNIIVQFDEPRRFRDGTTQTEFNFNPYNLAPLGRVVKLYNDPTVMRKEPVELLGEFKFEGDEKVPR